MSLEIRKFGKTQFRQSFPWGIYTRNGHRALCSDGVIRAVEMSPSPDSFFSIPARARIAGKWLSGYVTTEQTEHGANIVCFRHHDDQTGLPAWPKAEELEKLVTTAS